MWYMSKLTKRSVLAAGAASGIAVLAATAKGAESFGNPDLPPQIHRLTPVARRARWKTTRRGDILRLWALCAYG
jgi:hypothetical protein